MAWLELLRCPLMLLVFLMCWHANGEFDYELAVPACGEQRPSASDAQSCVGARRSQLDDIAYEVLTLIETDADCVETAYRELIDTPLDHPVSPMVATCALPAVLTFQVFAAAAGLRTGCSGDGLLDPDAKCDAAMALNTMRSALGNFRARIHSFVASMALPPAVASTVRRYVLEEAESMGNMLRRLWTPEALSSWAANPAALSVAALTTCRNLGLSRRVLYWRSNMLRSLVDYDLDHYAHLVAPRGEFVSSRQQALTELLGGPPAAEQKFVEVGIHLARLAFALLGSLQGLQYIGVDPFVYDENTSPESRAKQLRDLGLEPEDEGGTGAYELSSEVRKAAEFKLSFFRDRAKLLAMPSVQAAATLPERSVDGVFIDGDHSYLQVVHDIEAWEPKVKRGGFLSGHDFGNNPDVARAVLERAAASNRTVHLTMDWVWYYYL